MPMLIVESSTYFHHVPVSIKSSLMRIRKQNGVILVLLRTPQVRKPEGRGDPLESDRQATDAQEVKKSRDEACPQPQVKCFPDYNVMLDQVEDLVEVHRSMAH